MTDFSFRFVIRRDMQSIEQIERTSFEFPWSESDFCRVMRRRDVTSLACEVGEDLVGYMIYAVTKSKLQLLNFAVHPNHRRRGVGTSMVQRLIAKLSPHRINRIELLVIETSMGALSFFRSVGFVATRLIRSPYEETNADGIAMRYVVARQSQEFSLMAIPPNHAARIR